MKGLFMKRGQGKTTALIYTSACTGYPIIVGTECKKRFIMGKAMALGVSIPEPISVKSQTRGLKLPGVLIDEAQDVLRQWAAETFNAPVVAFTMTKDEEEL